MIHPRSSGSRATMLAFLLVLAAGPAFAEAPTQESSWNPSCYTLKRSAQNMLMGPADMVTSPVVAGKSIYVNMRDIDDSTAVRIFYPVPGYLWNTMVNFGAGTLRTLTGVMELVPGIVLCPFEAELDPLFDPAEDNEALVDWENGIFDVKFGVDYTTAG